MPVFSVDRDYISWWSTTLLVVVVGVVVLRKGLLPRLRWWRDVKVLGGWVRLLPSFYRLRHMTGPVLWSGAVKKFGDNPLLWSLTFSQVDDWCAELYREVFSEIELDRPFGIYVDDAKLGIIIMVTGLKFGIPLMLYHLSAYGQLLRHQISQIPEVKYMLISTRRLPQIQEATSDWVVKNNLWDKSLRFRSLCVIERRSKSLEESEESSEEVKSEVTEGVEIVETQEEVKDTKDDVTNNTEDKDAEDTISDYKQTYKDIFAVLYTSGTSGLSKGTMVKTTKFALMGPRLAHELSVTSRDIILMINPVTRVIWPLAVALATGCSIHPSYTVKDLPPNIKATIVNTAYEPLVDLVESIERRKHSIPNARLWMALGFPGDTARRIQSMYPKLDLVNYYGNTEGIVALFSWNNVLACGYRPKYFLSHLVQLLEVDEEMNLIRDPETGLCVRSNKGLMVKMRSKYSQINKYVGIAEEGKLVKDVLVPGDLYEKTGDIIRDDGRGNLYFVQRAGDNFRYKNQNTSCAHLENMLHQLAAVRSCAVYAVKHPDFEHAVGMAAIQLENHSKTNSKSLFISIYKHLDRNSEVIPMFMRIVEKFSLLETCKIDKMKLKREGFQMEGVHVCDDEKRTYVPFTSSLRLLAEQEEPALGPGNKADY